MFGIKDIAETIQIILTVITWKRLSIFTVFLLIMGVSYGIWENRSSVYTSVRTARVPTKYSYGINISQYNIDLIENTIKKFSQIAGIQVVNVNFQKNTQSISYSGINKIDTKVIIDENFVEFPLFTTNEEQNQKMISVINGDFICVPSKDTRGLKLVDGNDTLTVCMIGIPPYYGEFNGYLIVFLKKQLTGIEMDQFHQLLSDISLSIYDRDIKTGK